MPKEIYLVGDRTYLKHTDSNGNLISLKSTSKPRELATTKSGVIILPDGDSNSLNNEVILLSELVDNFGATTPEELLEAIGSKNFFKKGGGGVSGEFTENFITTIDVGGVPANTAVNKGDTIASFIQKMVVKYLPSSFKSFSLNASKTNPVAGENITISEATLSYNTDSDGDNPNNVAISGLNFNTAVPEGITNVMVSYQENGETKNEIHLAKNGGQYQQWTLSGKDAEGNSIPSRTYRVTWYNQFLFGASSLVIDQTNFQQILDSLTASKLNGKSCTKTTNADNKDSNNYTYIAYASSYDDLNNIILNGATPVLGAVSKAGVFNWENSFGQIIPVIVYKTNAKGAFGVGTTLKFS